MEITGDLKIEVTLPRRVGKRRIRMRKIEVELPAVFAEIVLDQFEEELIEKFGVEKILKDCVDYILSQYFLPVYIDPDEIIEPNE